MYSTQDEVLFFNIEVNGMNELGSKLYPHGAFAMKTCVSDGTIGISAILQVCLCIYIYIYIDVSLSLLVLSLSLSCVHILAIRCIHVWMCISLCVQHRSKKWVARLLGALSDEHSLDPNSQGFSVTGINMQARDTSNNSNHHQKAEPVVTCSVRPPSCEAPVKVQIHFNEVTGLAEAALCEYMDRMVAKGHLFKHTIILVEAWAERNGILGKNQLSVRFMRGLVVFIFNAFHRSIHTVSLSLSLSLSLINVHTSDDM